MLWDGTLISKQSRTCKDCSNSGDAKCDGWVVGVERWPIFSHLTGNKLSWSGTWCQGNSGDA